MAAGRKEILAYARTHRKDVPYPKKRAWTSHKSCNSDEIYEMAKYGQTDVQIARRQGISVDTLNNHFSEILARGRIDGENELLKSQYDKATGKSIKGDTTLLVYLGKCRLKQRDSDIPVENNKCLVDKLFDKWDDDSKKLKEKNGNPDA